jgi:formylglycine-generating enzyme required for sulfatase activity
MRDVHQQKKQWRSVRPALALMLVLSGLVLWLQSGGSQAQQQRDRQLERTGEANAGNGKRIALVIGNGTYTSAPLLKNPPNDAKDMADALSRLGFNVEQGIELNQRLMKQMIRQFGQKLKAGGQGIFYYAGHGVQSKGRNYLIPVDAVIESEADVEDQGVDVQLMLNYMDDAQNGLNIVILDACRNNPFARSFRSAEKGLAQVDAPTGTLIAYATAPGRVASDGAGKNGLYTLELLKQMRVPGLSVTEMFMRVRAEVVRQTGGKQVPWEASSLIGSFSFNAGATSASSTATMPGTALADAATVEADYWASIKNSTEASDYQEYLKEYPQGRYAQLARLKARQLEVLHKNGNSGGGNVSAPATGNLPVSSAARPKPFRNQYGIDLIYIPPGEFVMGSDNGALVEKPVHRVRISNGFLMGRTEVTQGQWKAVMGTTVRQQRDKANPSSPLRGEGDEYPIYYLSWNEAQEFIRKLNQLNDGYVYRLPTEAEWEYTCRAGTTGDYAGDLDSMAWYEDNSGGQTHSVATKQPNGFGLYDMHGNVWELCEDYYHYSYSGAPTDGSAWLSGGDMEYRVLRGGSWDFGATLLRSAFRSRASPDLRLSDNGFRVVAVVRTT